MSTPLAPEDARHYAAVIDAILATADLATVTRKKVRSGLETALGNKDLSQQKDAIKSLIEQRFDAVAQRSQAQIIPSPPVVKRELDDAPSSIKRARDDGHTNGHSHNHTTQAAPQAARSAYNSDGDENATSATPDSRIASPPRKKKVKHESPEDDDARIAAAMQEEENRMARGRTTRGGGPTKPKKAKTKTPKKKSAAKIGAGEDSDLEGEHGDKPKRKPGGGFNKPFALSYALQDVVGVEELSRPQVVKKLWEHIHAQGLQDPKDKRQILCDQKMMAVFKQPSMSMFQMNKLLSAHLYPVTGEE